MQRSAWVRMPGGTLPLAAVSQKKRHGRNANAAWHSHMYIVVYTYGGDRQMELAATG